MATLYSNQKTKWSQNVPSEKIKASEQSGKLRIAFADVTLAAADIADVVQMFNLPNGARIVDGYLANAALGSSTTLSVGYGAYFTSAKVSTALSAAAYLAATSTSSAARTDIAATIALGSGSVVDADENGLPITITVGGAAATGVVRLTIRYVVE